MIYNQEQLKIINCENKHILVIASAGSGKTTTIIARIHHIITNKKIQPDKILCLSFSRRSSLDIINKTQNLNIKVSTFHKLAYDYIKSIEPIKIIDLISEFTLKDQKEICLYKNYSQKRKPLLYEEYCSFLKNKNTIDFDDLLKRFYECLLNKEIIMDYEYIFVDEFQDTNNLQYMILKLLGLNKFILCVGDPDQSIYSFRGANSKIIDLFISEYEPTIFSLLTNYRSDISIISYANIAISKNIFRYHKNLFGISKAPGFVKIIKYFSEAERNKIINDLYYELITSTKDIALLYRHNKSAFSLLEKSDLSFTFKPYIMSIHQAKGLEFDYVFIIDCNDIVMPGYCEMIKDLEEERRIFYVALTRAKKGIVLLYDANILITRFIK